LFSGSPYPPPYKLYIYYIFDDRVVVGAADAVYKYYCDEAGPGPEAEAFYNPANRLAAFIKLAPNAC
jgi:hypothetical protein